MEAAVTDEEPCTPRWYERRAMDAGLAAVLAIGVFVVHPIGYVFGHPFWLDEAWVATLARAPLSDALTHASSTPIGWLLLVRAVPGRQGEAARLVPLLFSAGAVTTAYYVGRQLPWRSPAFARVAGMAVGLVVLLAPASLVRNDLKQYTADAFFSLLILALANRAERAPDTRTMVELVVVSVVAVFFSTASAFVVAAVFGGLLVAACLAGSRARVRTVMIGGLVAGAATAVYFLLVVIPHTDAALRTYWAGYYLPVAPRALATTWTRLSALAPALALPAFVAVALFAVGCIVLYRMGRPGLGCAVVLLWVEMIVVAMARRYPLLDLRTSYFLLIVSLVTISVGVLGIVRRLASQSQVVAVTVAVLATALYLQAAVPHIRDRSLPNEDVRAVTRYVAHHRRPGDAIVVSLSSAYGFSYYWPDSAVELRSDDSSTGFATRVRGLPDVVYAEGVTAEDTVHALQLALLHRPPGRRIWIVRSHLVPEAADAWHEAFRLLHLRAERHHAGRDTYWIVAPAAAGTVG